MTTPRPLVAVVTAAHNAARHIAECIESVLRQTYADWEYLILDHGSTDDTSRILADFAGGDQRIRIIRMPAALGETQALNHALQQISTAASYCKVVGPADLLYPQCLERMVAVGEAYPRVAFVSAYALEDDYVRGDGLPYPSISVAGHEAARLSLLRDLAAFGTPTAVLWRASVVRSRAAFYDDATHAAHVEACYDALKDGDMGFVHQVLTRTRTDTTWFAAASFADMAGRLVALERYAPTFLGPEHQAELAAVSERLWHDYYTVMGRCALQRKGRAFWDYHRGQLRRVGRGLEPLRLAGGAARTIADLVRHPGHWAGALRRRFFPDVA